MSLRTDVKNEWIDLIDQPCRTSDDQELGHLEAIGSQFILIKKVYLAIHFHYYYIPYNKVQGWDGSTIWLGISKTKVEQDYEKHKAPDPAHVEKLDYVIFDMSTNGSHYLSFMHNSIVKYGSKFT